MSRGQTTIMGLLRGRGPRGHDPSPNVVTKVQQTIHSAAVIVIAAAQGLAEGHEASPNDGGARGYARRVSIVSDVKERGFDAVREWALELDGAEPARAVADSDGLPREALLQLADRVRRWHEAQRPADITLEVEPGVTLERRWLALDTVGVYVPRNLISTLVMCAVPAQAAGVRRIVVCTPPSGAGLIAAAAEVLGIDEVWAIGGAQAIGWLAYVERVDKIVGPGNAYVNEAKLEVSRDVPIDLPGGPSEVVVLGDGDPELIELELAAQREHGHEAVCRTVDTLEEAEAIAPEHLVLLGDAEAYADQVRNAGSVFVGPWSAVPAGDYATGGNHVLPTNGWARSVGGLGLETFLKPLTIQRLTKEGLERIAPTVEALAAAEGMPAHAEAVRRRT
jgi:histidinol dehydrogenase